MQSNFTVKYIFLDMQLLYEKKSSVPFVAFCMYENNNYNPVFE